MYPAYSRSQKKIPTVARLNLYPGMLASFSTNHSLHFAGEQDTVHVQVVLHCKHEVSNLYLLLFTVDSGFVLVVLTVMAVLSFAWLSLYANMLAIILS